MEHLPGGRLSKLGRNGEVGLSQVLEGVAQSYQC